MSRNPLGARVPPSAIKPPRVLADGSMEQYHGGSFGVYMAHKTSKLHEQFQERVAEQRTQLFEGITIHVNGFTNPSHSELKQLMGLHGGRFEVYPSTSRPVTHIVCSNLPDAKVKQMQRERSPTPVVRPEWVVDSIKAQRVLPIEDYVLWQLRDAPGQRKLKEFAPVRPADLPPSAIYGQGTAAHESGDGGGAGQPAVPGGAQPGEALCSPGLQSPHRRSTTPPTATGASDLRPPSPARPPSPHSSYDPAEMQRAQQIAQRMRAECDLLKGPPRSSKDDPKFVDSFFRASRLHYIGSFKSRIEALMATSGSGGPSPSPYAPGCPRAIMHLDMDCFFAAVAEAEHPVFKGKPLAVCHSASSTGTGEVSTSNYEARKFGVRSGMFISTAKELCPQLIVVPYLFEQYASVSEKVYRILLRHTACVQFLSCDEAYLDITGLGEPLELAAKIRAEIEAATGCTASAGISTNQLLARIATEGAKPNGQRMVTRQAAEEFLRGLEVTRLPGVGPRTAPKLAEQGIHTVADVQARSLPTLQKLLGDKLGAMLWDFAHGKDKRRVEPPKPRKSIGAEVNWGVRFQTVAESREFLGRLALEVQTRLREARAKGSSLTLKIMRRRPGAPEPIKHMGHGICDNLSRSTTLASFTDSSKEIASECWQLLCALKVPFGDIRGMGITVTRLNTAPPPGPARPGSAGAARPPAPLAGQQGMGAFLKPHPQPAQPQDQQHLQLEQQQPGSHVEQQQQPGSHVEQQQQPGSHVEQQQPGSHLEQQQRDSSVEQQQQQQQEQQQHAEQHFAPQNQDVSLSQMDASVLAALPWSVQKELVEAAARRRELQGAQPPEGSRDVATGAVASGSASRVNASGAGRSADAAAKAQLGSQVLAAVRRATSSDEEDGWDPPTPPVEAAGEGSGAGIAAPAPRQPRGGAAAPAAPWHSGRPAPSDSGMAGGSGGGGVALPAFSQVDRSVWDALPLGLRRELELAYGIGAGAAKRPAPAGTAGRRGARTGSAPPKRQRIDAFIAHPAGQPGAAPGPTAAAQVGRQHMSLSQVDPAVLAELPPDVRHEVVQQLAAGGGWQRATRHHSRLGRQHDEARAWQQRWEQERQAAEVEVAELAADAAAAVGGLPSQDGLGQGEPEALLVGAGDVQLPTPVQQFLAEAAEAEAGPSPVRGLASALTACVHQLEARLPGSSGAQPQLGRSPRSPPDAGGGSMGARGSQPTGMQGDLPPTQPVALDQPACEGAAGSQAGTQVAPAAQEQACQPGGTQPLEGQQTAMPPRGDLPSPPDSPLPPGCGVQHGLQALRSSMQHAAISLLTARDLEQLRLLLAAVQRLAARHAWFAAAVGDPVVQTAQARVQALYGWRLRLAPGLDLAGGRAAAE